MMNLGMGAVMALPVIVAVAPMQAEASMSNDKGTFAEISQKESANFKVKNIENSLVSVGKNMMMAVSDKGKVSAWGDNSTGAYGSNLGANGDYINTTPKESSDISDVRGVKTNGNVSFVIKDDGSLWGTGSSDFQFLPSKPTEEKKYVPIKGITEEVVKVDISTKWVVALTLSGKVYVWGNDDSTPKLLDSVHNIEDVSVSEKAIGVLHENGTVSVLEAYTEGDKTSFDEVKPNKVPQLVNIRTIDLAKDSSDMLTLSATGVVVGVNTETLKTTPVDVDYNYGIISIEAGSRGEHYLLDANGYVYGFNDNRFDNWYREGYDIYTTAYKNYKLRDIVSMDGGFGAFVAVSKTGEAYTWAEGSLKYRESTIPKHTLGRSGDFFANGVIKGNYSTSIINEATKKNFAPFISDYSSVTIGYDEDYSLELKISVNVYDANVGDSAVIHYSIDGEETATTYYHDTNRKDSEYFGDYLKLPKVVGDHEVKIWAEDAEGLKSNIKTITYNVPEGSLDTPREYFFPELGIDFASDNIISDGTYQTSSSLQGSTQEVAPEGSLVVPLFGYLSYHWEGYPDSKIFTLKYSLDDVEYEGGYINDEEAYSRDINHEIIIPNNDSGDKPKYLTVWLVDENGHESSKSKLTLDYKATGEQDSTESDKETISANYKIPEVTGGSVGTDLENFKQTGDLGFKVKVK